MAYTVRDEDMPAVIDALRVAHSVTDHHSRERARAGQPMLAQDFAARAAVMARVADEMEQEG